jgi:hypothetical protein
VTLGLRRRGIEVLTAQEADRCGVGDADQLAFAASQQRVMVTFNADYLALHKSDVSHAGIARCPQEKYNIGMLVQLLELLQETVDREAMRTTWNTYDG